jgi:hypothetical protein
MSETLHLILHSQDWSAKKILSPRLCFLSVCCSDRFFLAVCYIVCKVLEYKLSWFELRGNVEGGCISSYVRLDTNYYYSGARNFAADSEFFQNVHFQNIGDYMFYSYPTGCTIFFFLEKFFALRVSDVTYIHRSFILYLHSIDPMLVTITSGYRKLSTKLICFVSVPTPVPAPCNKHQNNKKPMAVHYSCAPDDGCM